MNSERRMPSPCSPDHDPPEPRGLGQHLFRDGAKRGDVPGMLHVEGRAHVQEADRSVGVPGAARAVPREGLLHEGAELGQRGQGDRAVLHDRDRLALALHGHRDVQRGFAHGPDRGLPGRILGAHGGAAGPGPPHDRGQAGEPARERSRRLARELHQEHAVGGGWNQLVDRRPERRIPAGERDHALVHELDGVRIELDDVLHGVERVEQRRERADPEHPPRGPARQLQLELAEERQRALGSHERLGERRLGAQQAVQHVAGHVAEHAGHARLELVRLARRDAAEGVGEFGRAEGSRALGRAEGGDAPVGQPRLDLAHVVGHDPVADRTRAAAVVAGHAADGGAARRGHVDRKEQSVARKPPVELVEHQAGLHPGRAGVAVEFQHPGSGGARRRSPPRGPPSGRTARFPPRGQAPAPLLRGRSPARRPRHRGCGGAPRRAA